MIWGFVRAFLLLLAGIPVTVAGLLVVPLALPFTKRDTASCKPFTQFYGTWAMVNLPGWAKWWDNPVDGALGDTRGWWNNYCLTNYGKDSTHFYPMFQWLAIRNPANYWSRIVTGIDEALCERSLAREWKYAKLWIAKHSNGRTYPLFEGFIPINGAKGIEWRIGWKIDLDVITSDMPDTERFRGSVFRISPWASQ